MIPLTPRQINDPVGSRPALRPETVKEPRTHCGAVNQRVLAGSVYPLLKYVVEQLDDINVVLIDDRIVVRLELPPDRDAPATLDFQVWQIADYRNYIGQGLERIILARAAAESENLMAIQ